MHPFRSRKNDAACRRAGVRGGGVLRTRSGRIRACKKDAEFPEGRFEGEYQSGQMGQTVNLLSYDFGGSNPSSPTDFFAGIAQSIEHQPSKLRVAGLSPVSRSFFEIAYVAQW